MTALSAFFVLGFGFTLGAIAAIAVVLVLVVTLLAFVGYMLRQRG